MGDYYEILRAELEATEAYYLSQDHYEPDEDSDDWLTGLPWVDPGDHPF